MQCRAVRTQSRPPGHAGGALQPQAAHQGRPGGAEGPQAAKLALRDGDHQALPASREFGGRGVDRDVLGRRVGPSRGGHYRGVVGHSGLSRRGQRAEPEDLRQDRRLAEREDRRPPSIRVPGRDLAEAQLGRRGEERLGAGGHRGQPRGVPGDTGRGGRFEGG